jgi:Gas vesicle synthesis protein GvpL/GvpF
VTTSVDSWCYVFGIVPADAPLPPSDQTGPATQLRLVTSGKLAAIVGTPPADRPLGRAADLVAHDRVLAAAVAAGTPVLPMRFGAVLSDESAVVEELLAANEERFRADLERVRGRVQYTVKVRYEQDAVLRDVIARSPEVAQLRASGDGGFDRQLQLGELVVRALEELRPADAAAVLDALDGLGEVRTDETPSPEEVLNAAFLVSAESAAEFEHRVEAVGRRHADRLRIRLVGPSPAYNFVGGS